MRLILMIVVAVGCGSVSPWDAQSRYKDLTKKHLSKLDRQDQGHLEPFSFAIIGDTQVALEGFEKARQKIDVSSANFTVILGDITDRGVIDEWNWVNRIIDRFKKPVLTVVGNHDGLSNGKELYEEIFGPLNYSFYYNGVKFIMWNNNHYEWNIDLDWLERESEYYPSIVLSHQPPYSGTMTADQEERWRVIRHNGSIVASIHGHMHKFKQVEEDGLPIFTVERVYRGGHAIAHFDGESVTFKEQR